MVHPRLRRIASAVLLCSLLLAGLGQAWASEPDGQIQASSFVIAYSGGVKNYLLKEPASCYYVSGGDGIVDFSFGESATYAFPNSDLLFVQEAHLYQRLADGSLERVKTKKYFQKPITDGNWFGIPSTSFDDLPAGPDYVAAITASWFSEFTANGWITHGYSVHERLIDYGNPLTLFDCRSPWGPLVNTNASSGIVNSTLSYTLRRYPIDVSVPITWDGKVIGTATTNANAQAIGNFPIPAAPMGPHTVRWNYGHWQTSRVFTVKPRIKVVPSASLHRGNTVNVSLRGFAAGETVRIRWKNSAGSWIQIAQVVTSSTGSKNIDVTVPSFAPIGANSVRGDGNKGGAAQTNAVTVISSAASSAAVFPSPSPAPTKTATPTSSPTVIPATATPTPTLTPTQTITTPTATATPTESSTATLASPNELTPTPTDELTVVPTETVEPTASGETG